MLRQARHGLSVRNFSSQSSWEWTADSKAQIQKTLAKFPSNYKRSGVIPLLYIAQRQNDVFMFFPSIKNWIPLEAMNSIAEIVGEHPMRVYEVATFYTMFNRSPMPKFHLQVCGTTPCMVRGADKIIQAIEEHGKCKLDGPASEDGNWMVQEVECLACCTNAPMMQVNNEWVYEDLTPENVVKLMDDMLEGKEKKGVQIEERMYADGPQGMTTLTGSPDTTKETFAMYDKFLDQKEPEKEKAE